MSSWLVIENQQKKEQQRELRNKIQMAGNLVDSLFLQLDFILHDYSSWDETYDFTKDLNQDFIDTNLDLSYFSNISLAAVIFLDNEENVIYADAVTPEGKPFEKIPESLLTNVKRDFPLIDPETGARGSFIQISPSELGLVVKRPVLDNNETASPAGWMIFIQRLTQESLDRYEGILGFPVTIFTAEEATFSEDIREDGFTVASPRQELLVASIPYRDISGSIPVIMEISLDRTSALLRKRAINVYYLIVLVILLAASIPAYLFISNHILGRIESLSSQVDRITKTKETGLKTEIPGTDEINQLGKSINRMIDSIETSQTEIWENERFLKNLIDSIPTGVFLINPETRKIEAANKYAQTLLEMPHDEIIGRGCKETICPLDNEECRDVLSGKNINGIKDSITTQSGKEIPVMESISRIERNGRNLVLITFMEITEIEKTQLALEEARENLEQKVEERTNRLKSIIDTAMNGILVFNDQGIITFFSPSAEEIFDYSSEEVIGQSFEILLTEPFSTSFNEALEQLHKGVALDFANRRFQIRALKKGGMPISIEIAVNLTVIEGARSIVAVMQDITKVLEFQETIKKEKENLAHILDTNPIGVIIVAENQVKYANSAMKELGFETGGSVGSTLLNAKDEMEVNRRFKEEGYCSNYEAKVQGEDRIRDMLISIFPFEYEGKQAFVGWHVDITERKSHREGAQREPGKIPASGGRTGNQIPDLQSRSGWCFFSSAAEGSKPFSGSVRRKIIGRKWMNCFDWHPESVELAAEKVKSFVEDPEQDFNQFEMEFVHLDGSERTILVSHHPVRDEKGRVITVDGLAEGYNGA